MIVHRHVHDLQQAARGAVVAVGNFDGVHLGHQAVIGATVAQARREGAPAAVLTFEPHPRRYFRPDLPPFLLTRTRTKARVIAGLGVDRLFVLRFNASLAQLTAEQFVDDILTRGLGARHVVVGYDFVFGKGRGGDPDMLRARLAPFGVGVTTMSPVSGSGGPEPVSSTAVRNALIAGDPGDAARLLGRPFEIEGRVRLGDQRGRTLGFPTANLWLEEYQRPALGVYAVRVAIGEARPGAALREPATWRDGVANLGLRPTIGGLTEPRLEVHLFDFAGDLYFKRLRVQLRAFLRPERKFDGLDTLKAQIARDAQDARGLLARG